MKLSELGTSVDTLSGVGPNTAKLFARCNIFTVSQLLSYYPRDYDDRTQIVNLKDFDKGRKVHAVCKVLSHSFFGYGKMKTLKITITDGTTKANLIAFNRPFLEKSLPQGCIVLVTGTFQVKYNELQSSAFDAERLSYDGEISDYINTPLPGSKIFPVYSLTDGLSNKAVIKAVAQSLTQYAKAIDNDLDDELISVHGLLTKSQALKEIHQPTSVEMLNKARQTLIYEELFFFEYKMALRAFEHRGKLPSISEAEVFEVSATPNKQEYDGKIPDAAPFFSTPDIEEKHFVENLSPRQKALLEKLPFKLTSGQQKAILEMNDDIDRSITDLNTMQNAIDKMDHTPFSMQRLLQGDVGSGKTLVSFFVCLRVVDYGGQCALMAPTELLAKQHAENAGKLLDKLNIHVAFLTGNVKSSGRKNLLKALSNGDIDIIIGTHALFAQDVIYNKLQIAIIDEQHKFGVTQREAIIAKGRISIKNSSGTEYSHTPDLLMMSATPIPQTLALTAFGDLDVSVIKTKPTGRKDIKTYLCVMGHESNAYEAVRKELEAGHQAYFVYPRIATEEKIEDIEAISEKESIKAAEDMYNFLSKEVYPKYKCALVHSKIEEDEQHKILDDFNANKIQVLIATTVVEVGVDNPNATCIVIEHADRFGLAELHQLRGRVGRSNLQSFCFLIYGKNITQTGIARLKALHETTDGFAIAEEDLKLRGPGEVAGTAQSGYLSLGLADLSRDKNILQQARYDAFTKVNKLMCISQN